MRLGKRNHRGGGRSLRSSRSPPAALRRSHAQPQTSCAMPQQGRDAVPYRHCCGVPSAVAGHGLRAAEWRGAASEERSTRRRKNDLARSQRYEPRHARLKAACCSTCERRASCAVTRPRRGPATTPQSHPCPVIWQNTLWTISQLWNGSLVANGEVAILPPLASSGVIVAVLTEDRVRITGVSGGRLQYLTDCDVFAEIWIPANDGFEATKRFWTAYKADAVSATLTVGSFYPQGRRLLPSG